MHIKLACPPPINPTSRRRAVSHIQSGSGWYQRVDGAALTRCWNGGVRGRVHEVPLTAGVPVRQQRDGLQLQRQEKIHHMEETVALPREGRKGQFIYFGVIIMLAL